MSEQRVSNERKKELEEVDPFQKSLLKAIAYAKEYKKQLILVAGAIILVVIVFSGVMYSFQKAENTADQLVSQALTQYAAINDPEKGYLETTEAFQNIFSDYGNTKAGKMAKIKFAKICYDASKFDQSYKYYKESLAILKNQAHMENFLLASLGHVSLARNEFDEAEKYFLQIEKGNTNLLKDEAIFALAMLYEKGDKLDQSKKMYQKIVSKYETSMYRPVAESKIDGMN